MKSQIHEFQKNKFLTMSKRIFMIAALMLTALLTAQNATWTGTKTFGSTLKFGGVLQNNANTKILSLDATGKPGWLDKAILVGQTGATGAVSATQTGLVNNVPLQELGGVDKLINGVRVGQGNRINLESTCFGTNSLSADTGGYNSAFGFETLMHNSTGIVNDAFGSKALNANVTGSYNVAFGAGALELTLGGFGNTAIGGFSLYHLQGTGWSQSAIGCRNTAIGGSAMMNATTGGFNVAVGSECLKGLTTGSKNIGIGERIGTSIITGSNNTLIGGTSTGDTSNTIIIGAGFTNRIMVDATGKTSLLNMLNVATTPIFDNNAAAIAGGLVTGDVYRTSAGVLMITF
jgi:hypothetical protein